MLETSSMQTICMPWDSLEHMHKIMRREMEAPEGLYELEARSALRACHERGKEI